MATNCCSVQIAASAAHHCFICKSAAHQEETVFVVLINCASEAVFCYAAENSHHLEALVTKKKSAVSRGENISYKYGEIIKKPYFLVWGNAH
jgi:hypothetical protein